MTSLLEQSLVDIWKFTLGLENIGMEETFNSLGGGSMLALATVGQLRQRLGWEMALGDFLRRPTLTEMLEDSPTCQLVNDSTAVVRFSNRGSKTPIVFVHPADGLVLVYAKLAHLLGLDRGCYGLQSAVFAGETLPESLDAQAELYADLLYAEFGEDEFHLIGWSTGGVLAYEIARCASDKGLNLLQLGLIDADIPSQINESRGADALLTQLYEDLRPQISSDWPAPTAGLSSECSVTKKDLARLLFGREPREDASSSVYAFIDDLLATYAAQVELLRDYAPQPLNSASPGFVLQSEPGSTKTDWITQSNDEMRFARISAGANGLSSKDGAVEIASLIELNLELHTTRVESLERR